MRLLVGTRKGLFIYCQRGAQWEVERTEFLGIPVTMVLQDPRTSALHVVLDHGHFGIKFHRAAGIAAPFAETAAPTYPPKPEGVADVDPGRGTPIPWALLGVWSLEAAGVDEPGRLWCGTMPGGLFRSDDGGDSWELQRGLWDHPARQEWFGGGKDWPGIHSICVHPERPGHLTVGISCGGVWVSTDAGATWSVQAKGMRAAYMPPDQALNPNIQDPHRVVQCRAAPDVLWAQHHNGIFVSRDGGRQWSETPAAGPSVFGSGPAVHPRNPDVPWFVPAAKDDLRIPVDGRFVVTQTTDGGRSFRVLAEGLPSGKAFDLVWRHGLDVSSDGDTLAVGSTSGSLWIGERGGARFRAQSHHLPPIAVVRFVS